MYKNTILGGEGREGEGMAGKGREGGRGGKN